MAEVEGLDPVASVVQRLAVLLAAGVAPASAWGYLAESAGFARVQVVQAVAERAGAVPIAEAVLAAVEELPVPARGGSRSHPAIAWRALAAAWLVAAEAGAPIAPSLRGLAESLRDLAETRREIEVALAGPAATARFVTVLPLVGILFGLGLGFDPLGTLFGTVPGVLCLITGSALMLAARAWDRRLLRSATPEDPAPGLPLELLAIAVSGGASLDRARHAVAGALDRCALTGSGEEEGVLELSRRAGVPAGLLLRSEAEQTRRIARSTARRKAASLSVTLMLPLGICVLPAFLLLGVAPLMIAVLSSTAGSF